MEFTGLRTQKTRDLLEHRIVGFSEPFGRFLHDLRSQMRVALRRLVVSVTQELANRVQRCAVADERK